MSASGEGSKTVPKQGTMPAGTHDDKESLSNKSSCDGEGSERVDMAKQESFAFSKDEASTFQDAIKNYCDRCVAKEELCTTAASNASK